jgi:hypothetical protein
VRYLYSGGFQQIELSDLPWPGEAGARAPRRFDDELSASAFLRRLLGDPEAMRGLREVLARASVSPDRLLGDDEIIEQLAARLRAGTLSLEVTTRMRPLPFGGVSDEPDEPLPPREEKVIQDVEFTITDPFDDPFPGLDWVLIYPDGTTKKTGKLGADGIVKESSVPPGNYQLVFKIVSAARWGAPQIEVGKEVKLEALAAGFDPATAGKFEIFDARATDGKPLAKVSGKVSAARVLEGSFTPDEAAMKDVKSGALVFRAKIGESSAMSAAAPLLIKHGFELSDEAGPLADTELVALFSDGHRATARSKGGKAELLVPVGQTLLWVHLPEHPGAEVAVEPEGGEAREYVQPPAEEAGGGASGDEDEDEEEENGEEIGDGDGNGDGNGNGAEEGSA